MPLSSAHAQQQTNAVQAKGFLWPATAYYIYSCTNVRRNVYCVTGTVCVLCAPAFLCETKGEGKEGEKERKYGESPVSRLFPTYLLIGCECCLFCLMIRPNTHTFPCKRRIHCTAVVAAPCEVAAHSIDTAVCIKFQIQIITHTHAHPLRADFQSEESSVTPQ